MRDSFAELIHFPELLPEDMKWVIRSLPRDIRTLLMQNPKKLFLAGGFIRALVAGEKPHDIDLLSATPEMAKELANKLVEDRGGRLHTSKNAYTVLLQYRLPVQFVHRWSYEDPRLLLCEFDFTVAQAVVWFDGELFQSMVSDRFYADLAARRLVYMAPSRAEDAGGSLLRVQKFLHRGYRISPESLGRVVARLVSGVDLKRLLDSKDEWTEDFLAKVLTGLLREVDPLTVVDGIETVGEDEE